MFVNFYADYNWLFGFLGGGVVLIVLIVLLLIVVEIVAKWKLFKKAGRNGWESLIPIYSSWVLVEISGLNWWWFLLLIFNFSFSGEIERFKMAINICGFLANFNCYYNIARKFGKDKTTSIFAGLFPFIFLLIFAFSKSDVYDMNIPVSANGIFGNEDNSFGNNDYYNDMNRYNNDSVNHQMNNENMNQSTTSVDKKISDNKNNKDGNINNTNREYSYCGNCGCKLDKDVNFCPNCGREKR